MQTRLLSLVLLLVGIVSAQETVHLKSGKFQRGKLVSQTDDALVFEFTKAGTSKATQVSIPWKSIERIEFPAASVLTNPETATIKQLAKLWDESVDWIGRAESPAGKIGLLYASKLAQSEVEMAPEQALDLYKEIAEQAWSPEDQSNAIQGRLKTLLDLGKEREAIREAEALAEQTENPSHLLAAKHLLATNAFNKLRLLVEENPRWELDDEVRPERNQLFNQAIDHSLFAFLFYGTEEAAAARGLLHAAEVYSFSGEPERAQTHANDVLRLYPESSFATSAQEQLTKYKNQEKKSE